MTTDELVTAVILKATGKPKSPAWGDKEYRRILDTANFYISSWQHEPNVDWASLYNPEFTISSSQEGIRLYKVDRSAFAKFSNTPGDFVMVGDSAFIIVPADLLKRYEGADACSVAGESIIFARNFYANETGKAIKAPVYLRAEKLTSANSKVPVDDPYWLVTICAAEYSRSDILLQNQYANLINEANTLMSKMIENNGAQVSHINYDVIPGVSDL